MARLTSLLLLGAALGASAHPSRHGHLHNKQRQVEKRDDGDTIVALINGEYVSWTQEGNYYNAAATSAAPSSTTVAAVAATTTSSAAAESTSAASSSSSSSSSGSTNSTGTVLTTYTSFDTLCSSSSKKRATKEQIAAVGNTGSDGDYGCNFAVTSVADVADQYDNYVKFYGATEDMTCYYWNKISKSGGINGWMTNEDSYYSFTLGSGETQYLVVDAGTYGGATCQPSSVAPVTNSDTGLLYTWVEFTFVDSSTGWSAVDASSIQADLAGGTVNGVEITADSQSTVSSICPDGTSLTNAFDSTLIDADGLGIQCSGSLKVNANFGYTC